MCIPLYSVVIQDAFVIKKKWYFCVREKGVLRNVLTLPAKRDVDLFQLREVLTLPVKIVIDLVSKEEC